MNPEYREWIEAWLRKHAFVRGMCGVAASEMVAAFPELTKVRGHVMTGMGREPHWWCTDLEGSIVDPTVIQFNHTAQRLVYEPFDEKLAHTLPTGKCMNCGGYLYYRADFCDVHCARGVCNDMEISMDISKFKFNPVDQPMYYEDEAP